MTDATIVVVGDRIMSVGPRTTTVIPDGAWQINVQGKYLTPGFVDTNLHVTRYWIEHSGPLNTDELAQETQFTLHAAKELLTHGVTTIRDTYGLLRPEIIAQDSLEHGEAIGTRILVGGNIIGLGKDPDAEIVQGMGRNLLDLKDDSLRALTDRYLDKGVDFIKIAVTDHDSPNPQPTLFSRAALETMVREAHQRGKLVDSHTNTPEGLRLAALAGVDIVQHPEALRGVNSNPQAIPSDVVDLLATKHVICSIFAGRRLVGFAHGFGSDEDRQQMQANAAALIRRGCLVSVATDHAGLEGLPWGQMTLRSIEALVRLGMTPGQALTAATRTGAIAAGAARDYGTLEAGKRADVVVLGADPLANIHNIEKVEMVFNHGYAIDSLGNKLHRPDMTK